MTNIMPETNELPRRLIRFEEGERRFQCRVAGIAYDSGRVLAHHADWEDFWTFPGGRAELGEPLADGLRREMQEELDTIVEVERLLWVVENFFIYDNKTYHELGFYFLMTLPADSPLRAARAPFVREDAGTQLIFEWHDLAALEGMRVFPAFLRGALQTLPDSPRHVVQYDDLAPTA
jgi:ADP-ribose pyrophosphatase YjhB (NUDIX family)